MRMVLNTQTPVPVKCAKKMAIFIVAEHWLVDVFVKFRFEVTQYLMDAAKEKVKCDQGDGHY